MQLRWKKPRGLQVTSPPKSTADEPWEDYLHRQHETGQILLINDHNRIVSHYNAGCFVKEKVLWDLLQIFTEQLLSSYGRDSVCCSVLLIEGQNFANPKSCRSNNLLLQQFAGLHSSTNPFLYNFNSTKRKSDFLWIQGRSQCQYHQERNVPQLALWFMTAPFRTITIYTFIYRVSWCHIFGISDWTIAVPIVSPSENV